MRSHLTARALLGAALIALAMGTAPACTSTSSTKAQPSAAKADEDLSHRGALLSYERVATVSPEAIDANIPRRDVSALVRHPVTLYRVRYASLYRGAPIALSGLVAVPDAPGPLSLLQYHHGTMLPFPTDDSEGANDVPSLYDGGPGRENARQFETRFLCLVPASHGYFVTCPDYAGYGVSSDVAHPYVIHRELADESLDMIRAGRALAHALGTPLTSSVFLGGWSEGGGAALATHRLADAEGMPIAGTAALAGPYVQHRFYTNIITAERELPAMHYYNWALWTMLGYAEPRRAPDTAWKVPVNSARDALALSSKNPRELFRPELIAEFKDDALSPLEEAMRANELVEGWAASGKIMLHSGKDDVVVPIYNSETAVAALEDKGANAVLVVHEGGHEEPAFDYLKQMLAAFDELAERAATPE